MRILGKHNEYGEISASNPAMLAVFLQSDCDVVVKAANLGLTIGGWRLEWEDDLPDEFPEDDDTMDLEDEESWNRKV